MPSPQTGARVVVVVMVLVVVVVVVVEPQTFGVPPPPQVCGRVHVPQLRVPPQPSAIIPQFAPTAAHVVGVKHVPKNFFLAWTHTPLQQFGLVRPSWPPP